MPIPKYDIPKIEEYSVDCLDKNFSFEGTYSAIDISPNSFNPLITNLRSGEYADALSERLAYPEQLLETYEDRSSPDISQHRVGFLLGLIECITNSSYDKDNNQLAKNVVIYLRNVNEGDLELVIATDLQFPEKSRGGLKSSRDLYHAGNVQLHQQLMSFCDFTKVDEIQEEQGGAGLGFSAMLGAFDKVEVYRNPDISGGTITRLYLRKNKLDEKLA